MSPTSTSAENSQGNDKGKGKAATEPTIFGNFTITAEPGGEKSGSSYLLSSSDAWDYLIEHPLVREGLVDITDASYRLRRTAKPGSQGPLFHQAEVKAAIEGSRRGGGDVLA
jgi:hypothetical protein